MADFVEVVCEVPLCSGAGGESVELADFGFVGRAIGGVDSHGHFEVDGD